MSVLLPILRRRSNFAILFNINKYSITNLNISVFTCNNYYASHFTNYSYERNTLKSNSYSINPPCVRNLSSNVNNNKNENNLGVVARFKQMYKDYWYVLVPVHLVTSAFWFGSFYYLAKSGVDVVGLLKALGISDRFSDSLKDSSMGYYALAYALYKVVTPIRYTVTLGGTTISINYLKSWGYIRPIPSREELKEMYQVKKEGLHGMYQETKQELQQRKDQIRERKDHVMKDLARYKQEMREVKENELKK